MYVIKTASTHISTIQEGDPVQLDLVTTCQNGVDTTQLWEDTEYALASTPLLIEEGKIIPRVLDTLENSTQKTTPEPL